MRWRYAWWWGMAVVLAALPAIAASTYTDNGDGTVTVEGGVGGIMVSVTGPQAPVDSLVVALSAQLGYSPTVPCVDGPTGRDADRVLVQAGAVEYACTVGTEIPNPQPTYDAAVIRLKQLVEADASAYARRIAEQSLPDTTVDLDTEP